MLASCYKKKKGKGEPQIGPIVTVSEVQTLAVNSAS